VCIPKTTRPSQPSDYRPITLLNTDYKFMARIVANRIRPTLEDLLHPSQFFGRPGNTFFETLASVREAVAVAEVKRKSLCILTLDFRDAFDRISHKYLFAILHRYGFSNSFVGRIRHMYTDASSMVQVNGHLLAPFPISAQYARVPAHHDAFHTLYQSPDISFRTTAAKHRSQLETAEDGGSRVCGRRHHPSDCTRRNRGN
jgi:hypothetical protein